MKKNFVPAGSLPSPAYFWLLNEPMTPEKLKRHLRLMAEQGMRAVCPHPWPKCFRSRTMPSCMEPDYLTPEYFAMLKVIADECRKLGMYCYLYDEGGWPSGYAAGKVRLSDPENFAPYFIDKNLQVKRIPLPPEGEVPVSDLLNRQAVEKFIELTHVPAVAAVRKNAGNVLFASFTDEPHFTRTLYGESIPWCKDFEKIFLKRKKYDILPYLKELFDPPAEEEFPEVRRARIDYHDVFSQLFVENYFIPLRKFCRKNKMLSGGHIDSDHDLHRAVIAGSGHLMRSLRALDLPGIDVIARQIMPGEFIFPFAKFASSVAKQSGRKSALAEIFAVYGSGITPMQMKYVIDTVMADGINTLVLSGYASSHKGMLSHLRPHLDPVDPLWKYGHIRNRYIENLGRWLSRGKSCTPVAVYCDQRSFWAGGKFERQAVSELNRLSRAVFNAGSDFDFADDDMLVKAQMVNGKIKIGKMYYDHLLLPEGVLLSPEAAENLKRKNIPLSTPEKLGSLLGVQPPEGVRFIKRLYRGREIVFIFNTSAEKQSICLSEKKEFVQIDLTSGESENKLAVGDKITVPAFDSALLVSGKNGKSVPVPGKSILLKNLRVKEIERVICTQDDFRRLKVSRSLEPQTGDWQKIAGGSFSGEISYCWDFELENNSEPFLLSLGRVHYAAEVFLNGKSVGQKLFPPFDFCLKKHLKRGHNLLEIRVTNTLANLLICDETQKSWQEQGVLLSPYEERQRNFEKESCVSGLLDEVRLRKANCRRI